MESFFESVVRDHSKGHAMTAPSSRTTRSPSYRYTTLADSTASVSRAELDRIQDSLNGRPRKTLGYMTPSEKFAELVATTA